MGRRSAGMASQVARILMGKENPQYTPFLDTGDHVIVINAGKVKTTGMKSEQKQYHHTPVLRRPAHPRITGKRLARKPKKTIERRAARVAKKQTGGSHAVEAEGLQG